jgi:medium-chain acyl-[acyl-carrier-protein] hydrolase
MAPPPNRWIFTPRPDPRARLRLVCFSYAGGNAAVFRTWPDALPAEIELVAIELPGRQARGREPLLDRLPPLVAALTDGVAGAIAPPFAIFGHSMGALVGLGFAHELRRRQLAGPVHLFASARRAPQLPERSPLHPLGDAALVDALRAMGGIPDAVLAEAELMAYFLPILRADLAVSETASIAGEAPLDCPITALCGASDERVTPDEVDAWRALTRAGFERALFPGGHFFIQTERAAVLAALSRRLSGILAELPGADR